MLSEDRGISLFLVTCSGDIIATVKDRARRRHDGASIQRYMSHRHDDRQVRVTCAVITSDDHSSTRTRPGRAHLSLPTARDPAGAAGSYRSSFYEQMTPGHAAARKAAILLSTLCADAAGWEEELGRASLVCIT